MDGRDGEWINASQRKPLDSRRPRSADEQQFHPGCQYLNFSPFHESICSSTSKGKQALFDNNDCPPAVFLHGQIGNDLPSRSQN